MPGGAFHSQKHLPGLDQSDATLLKPVTMKRLLWLDMAKGIAILWVVYFHFFSTYFTPATVGPDDWSSFAAGAVTVLKVIWLKVSGLGFHAVGVFLILSGWALMQSTMRRAAHGPVAWGAWYFARFLRLYPMYWVAHLVYLISPCVARLEPVDGRIVWSLLGLRFVDITMNFMYLNAAWWYFAMLIQFYLIFPLLFWAIQTMGTMDVPGGGLCPRIFRTLPDAHTLSAKWPLDAGRLRGLPAAGIRARHVVRGVA